jgi:hypothetical protein
MSNLPNLKRNQPLKEAPEIETTSILPSSTIVECCEAKKSDTRAQPWRSHWPPQKASAGPPYGFKKGETIAIYGNWDKALTPRYDSTTSEQHWRHANGYWSHWLRVRWAVKTVQEEVYARSRMFTVYAFIFDPGAFTTLISVLHGPIVSIFITRLKVLFVCSFRSQ